MEKTQAIPLRGTTLGGSQEEVMVTKQEREKEDAGERVDHPAENSDVKSELGLNVVGPPERPSEVHLKNKCILMF